MRLASLAILLALTSTARADNDKQSATLAYTFTALELSTFGVFAGNFSDHWIDGAPGLLLDAAPIPLSVGAAFAAHYGDLDARPAHAIHGGWWYGVSGFMLGALLDGRADAWKLKAGTFAWTLGAVGALTGGLLGALTVDGNDEGNYWTVAPIAGFAAGGIVLGTIMVGIGQFDGDNAAGQWATGALIGLAGGLGVATYMALRGSSDEPATRLSPATAVTDDGTTIFSFGGAF